MADSVESSGLYPVSSIVQCGLPQCSEMTNLKTCSRCKNQWYCSVEHQKVHWAVHKTVCKKPTSKPTKNFDKDPLSGTTPMSGVNAIAPNAGKQRYSLRNMPQDIAPVYAVRKEITIRHGYNLMDKAVKGFFTAMKNDRYPIEENEGLFGIQMEPAQELVDGIMQTSLGNLVYLTWVAIWKSKYTKEDEERKGLCNEIVMMILMGKLPEWYQLEVMEYADTAPGQHNAYVNELLRRGMDNITYDIMLYKFCWGEINEVDIAFLAKTAE